MLDEGQYLCSERTMYRVLAVHHEVRERRNQLRHPHYAPPELLARQPKELWSWDITKLLGPAKWTYFYLYVMLDVFGRYVVGWMVAHRESAAFAEKFVRETCARQGIAFPGRFGSIQDARAHCHVFLPWYNTKHHHSGLGLLTPADVHQGLAEQRVAARAVVLTTAYAAHPERLPAGRPHPPARPVEVWINPPRISVPLQTSSAIPPCALARAGAFA